MEGHGLKRHAYAVLALACTELGPTQRELASIVRLDPSRLVSVLDDLESEGLVARRQDPLDRRSRRIQATDEGRVVRAQAAEAVGATIDELLHVFTSGERRSLVDLLQRLAFCGDKG